ncbi:hypothetical protein [Psychrobacter sp.]|uniref:hypothetical protein n=1 Tax=Psychrobacter sp. TaxID=56811 RepID=UPI0035638CD3
MKKSLILTCTLLLTHTVQASFPSEIKSKTDSIHAPSQHPKELQKLGVYIDSTLDAVQNVSDNNEDLCSTQSVFAFNVMKMRQKGVDYSDIYHLMNINNKADLTIKGIAKLESYKGVFEEAYKYPIYTSKEDKGTATTLYMTYKNHQCLLSL